MKEENSRTLANRLICYFSGLFIMTVGIAISVKSDLGVSPVSSLPYTMTRCFGIEMGKATIMLHCALVLIQVILLRKDFKLKSLLQVPVGVIFGYFTTFCNYLMTLLPDTENIVIRLVMIIFSAFLIAVGIFFYLPADIVPLAGEGATKTVSDIWGIALSKAKTGMDITLVVISAIVCLAVLHNICSIGIGTVIAAVLVGPFLGQITKFAEGRRKEKK